MNQRSGAVWDTSTEGLLGDWGRRCAAAKAAHYQLESTLRRRYVGLGVPAVVLSTAVGTTVFATINVGKIALCWRVAVGSVSVAAAVLTGLQTFLRFGQRTEQHVVAGDWYAALQREIEEILALPASARGGPKECLDRLRKEMSKVGQQSPAIGQPLWLAVAKQHNVRDPGAPPRG